MELYKKYRPVNFAQVVGQDDAIAALKKLIDTGNIPHAIIFTGPSGTGKTTIARILRPILKCGEREFLELNCADFRSIDDIRQIRRTMHLAPMFGESRVWLIDECHKLTNDAQNAFLKMLEDTPDHVYFILATTEPRKVIPTIMTRCSEVKLKTLPPKEVEKLLRRVITKENLNISEDVLSEIVSAAEGSGRKALVILEQIHRLEGDEEKIRGIQNSTFNKELAITLARSLYDPRTSWGDVASILKQMNDDEPEGVRYLILAYSRSILLSGGPKASRAFILIDIFQHNFYDSKQAGLAAACWEAVCGAKTR